MSLENVCYHNKFGFCKFGEKCFRHHENKMCESEKYSIQNCPLRHPQYCRYIGKFRYCKFGTYCRYRHDSTRSERRITSETDKAYDDDLDDLNNRLKVCKAKIEE